MTFAFKVMSHKAYPSNVMKYQISLEVEGTAFGPDCIQGFKAMNRLFPAIQCVTLIFWRSSVVNLKWLSNVQLLTSDQKMFFPATNFGF